MLLRPIPWEEPDRLALLQEVQRDSADASNPSTANYVDVRDQSDVFEQTAPFRFVYFNLSDGRANPERVQGLRVTSDFFRLIGVKPALGRLFLPEEERPGGDRAVLLANGFWQQRYGSDPAIVGKTVILEGEPHTVAGVLPEFLANQTMHEFEVGNIWLREYRLARGSSPENAGPVPDDAR